jgi:hypothetical protein
MTRIIAFTGLAGSGKSTAADYLVKRHGFVRTRFANSLKNMLRALGLSQAEIDGDLKEQPSALLMRKTPRWAMQTLGTEWGRYWIDADIWVALWQRTACDVLDHGGRVVVDDCRFDNEARMIQSMSGSMICKIERPGAGTTSSHVSENSNLPFDAMIRNMICNDGELTALYQKLDWCFDLNRAVAV